MSVIYLATLIVFWLHSTGTSALYFPVTEYNVNLAVNSKKGDTVLQVYALPSYPAKTLPNLFYAISRQSSNKKWSWQKQKQFFRIYRGNGSITLTTDIPDSDYEEGTDDTVHELTVKAVERRPTYGLEATAKVKIRIKRSVTCASLTKTFCFGSNTQFVLEENLKSTSFGNIRPPASTINACPDYIFKYTIVQDKTKAIEFDVNSETSELKSKNGLDAESSLAANFAVNCTLMRGNQAVKWFTQIINIAVIDVGDNLPTIHQQSGPSNIYIPQWLTKYNKLTDITITDLDVNTTKSTYSVSIRNDAAGQFSVPRNKTYFFKSSDTLVVGVFWNKPPATDVTQYDFEVVIKDNEYKGPIQDNELIYPIRVTRRVLSPPIKDEYSAVIDRAATIYAKVNYTAYSSTPLSTYRFKNKTNKVEGRRIFGITHKGGLLYVKHLQMFTGNTIKLSVVEHFHNNTERTFVINVAIKDTDAVKQNGCSGCASAKDEDSCKSTCGLGSHNGQCTWRHQGDNKTHSPQYATCTPDTSTCPDAVCDDVEQKNPMICPQDCTEKVDDFSHARINRHTLRGVVQCQGSCWCDGTPVECYCYDGKDYNFTEKTITVIANGSRANKMELKKARSEFSTQTLERSTCNQNCQITVGVSAGFVSLVIGAVILVKAFYKRKLDRGKTSGSAMSLTAIPSDYVQRRASITASVDWSPTFLRHKIPFDAKWEFPRKDLILDKMLGEGEFGKVVKAEALSINGKEGYSIVAVKMLKDNATNAEFRDLLSEFNLLKDVTHPNVIKLLGACTQEQGPFYVIVEFCELGSLRCFLRETRDVEGHYLEQTRTEDDDSEYDNDDSISPRDLLSFAWQIAKGMQYLTEMKLVHRDLAARNVLVATGKLIKISDFGLSRDVYEEDAYRKQSKGRIPVKWMAPESLYHQVYTSKSDVWSYGVTLWEIATLGATPYPGIAPERLFHLLKEGYRMERPDNCSKELFTIMRHCWSDNPLNRPCFFDLANVFDKMLQQDVEYLDLVNYERQPIYDDFEDLLGRTGNVTDSSDEEDGNGYGNINMLPCDDDSYLTPLPRPWQDHGHCPECGADALFSQSGREMDFACECSLLISEAGSSGTRRERYKDNEQLRIPLMACENLEYMRTTVV